MSDPITSVRVTLEIASPDVPDDWTAEISIASFLTDPAYRAEVLRIYREDGRLARMVKVTRIEEVLDE